MGSFRDGKKTEDDDESYYSSSDCSSSSSSCRSSSSDESCYSDRSSSIARRKSHRHGVIRHEDYSFFRLPSLMRHRRTTINDNYEHGFHQRGPKKARREGGKIKHDDGEKHGYERGYEHEYEYGYSSSSDASSSKNRIIKSRGRGHNGSSFHWSSRLLALSLLLWCGVQISTTEYVQQQSLRQINTDIHQRQDNHYHGIDRVNSHRPYRNINANSNTNIDPPRPHPRPRPHPHPHRPPPHKKEKERLQPGCELDPEWQTPQSNSKLLSCQLLHELDLSEALSTVSSASGSSRRRRHLSSSSHLGSGLWRDVWKIRDSVSFDKNNNTNSNSNNKYLVLKTMKPEHEVIHRNLERHRREAAAMNRLTSSPYVVDLYAYCGNSILTEFATQDLSRALNTNGKRDINDSHNERRRKIKDANRAHRAKEYKESERLLRNKKSTKNFVGKMEIHDNSKRIETDSEASPKILSSTESLTLSLAKRLDWALQASKAIAAMHRSDVIHADITTKQFLVVGGREVVDNTSNNENSNDYDIVRIKINDFNRCRFVPRRQQSQHNQTATGLTVDASARSSWNSSAERCTIQIPSAPGSYRSPEEYSDKVLTPQMDVFSLGHVLYEIWTSGKSPWQDLGGRRIKNMVRDGKLPIKLTQLEEWDSLHEPNKQGEQNNADNDPDAGNADYRRIADDRAFGRIIRECYWVDPERRITADGLVQELTKLLKSVEKKYDTAIE